MDKRGQENMNDPTAHELTQQVIRAIAEARGVSPDSIRPDSTFDELGVDSLDGINIAFALEESFDIDIPDDAVRSFSSVQEVADGLREMVTKSGDS